MKSDYLSCTKHPTNDNTSPMDAPQIAMKLFNAKAMPTKLTHTPMIPILIPFIQLRSFVKFKDSISFILYSVILRERSDRRIYSMRFFTSFRMTFSLTCHSEERSDVGIRFIIWYYGLPRAASRPRKVAVIQIGIWRIKKYPCYI